MPILNPFSIRTEGHIKRKSITFLIFPSKLKEFSEKVLKKYGNFNPFSIRTEGHISKKSIENFHPNRRTFLKKVWKKDAIYNPFSIRTEGHVNRKSITFLNFPSKPKDFFEKSIEKGGKFQSFFDQNRRTYK